MRLQKAKKGDLPFLKDLYKSAFPRDERAPFFLLKKRHRQKRGTMLVATDKGKRVALVYMVTGPELAYVFYLAVAESERGHGYGSRILRMLQRHYADRTLFLAREQLDPDSENYEQRLRRHAFYLRNGFKDVPCMIKEASVVYDVMSAGGPVSEKGYADMIHHWCGRLVSRMIDMRVIRKHHVYE